jgi:hypothetical protein
MDARLVLVLTVLLVATSDAMKVYEVETNPILRTEHVEQLLRKEPLPFRSTAHVLSLARDLEIYEELIGVNSYEDSDCTQAELEKRAKICRKYSQKYSQNHNRYCASCVEKLIRHCVEHPSAVLAANVNGEYLEVIKSFESNLTKFISDNGIPDALLTSIKLLDSFFLEPKHLELLEKLKVACDHYSQKANESLKYFKSISDVFSFKKANIEKKLKDEEVNGSRRGLLDAVEDCKIVVGFDPEEYRHSRGDMR